jgi:hypothetical protein
LKGGIPYGNQEIVSQKIVGQKSACEEKNG